MIEQFAMAGGRVAVVGHRGAAAYAPENTIASFELAAALGAHAFECDARLTRDGHVVVAHDASVDRVANGSGLVADLTLAQLRALDVGVRLPQPGRQQMPTLAEALWAAGRLGMDIVVELKGEPEPTHELAVKAVAAVRDERMVDRCAVQSFHPQCLTWVREEDDRLPTGILFVDAADPVGEARAHGAASLRPHRDRVTARLVEEAHAAGLCVYAWRVNDAEDVRRMALAGVDSVGSDRPDLAREVLVSMGRLA